MPAKWFGAKRPHRAATGPYSPAGFPANSRGCCVAVSCVGAGASYIVTGIGRHHLANFGLPRLKLEGYRAVLAARAAVRGARRPVGGGTFICGSPHSGTTLLATMFAAHPDIFVPLREMSVFVEPPLIPVRLDILRLEAALSGRPHFAEKTPRHVHFIGRMRDMVPGARIVVVMRDGRDVAASYV
jgi:hypothetical protein